MTAPERDETRERVEALDDRHPDKLAVIAADMEREARPDLAALTRERFGFGGGEAAAGPVADGLRPCGTEAARRRHRRRGEPVDDACREGHAAEMRAHRADRVDERARARADRAARWRALQALRHRHMAEFRALLALEVAR